MAYKTEDVLEDIYNRQEYQVTTKYSLENLSGYINDTIELVLPGLKLTGAQHFIKNFQNPNTPVNRLLILWKTGVGKSIGAISIAHEFIKTFKDGCIKTCEEPSVFVLSFTGKETIQNDILSFPEFGFVTKEESDEWKRLRTEQNDPPKLTAMNAAFRRRITDKKRGGYYQFYGYKEFANKIFTLLDTTFDLQSLYTMDKENFLEAIEQAQKDKKVKINKNLLDSMRNGLLICDEIHNTYNIQETNNYGIAIHYALNYLRNEAPRSVFMSATPMTGSSTEIVDLLNLLTPCSNYLRKDIFTKVDGNWKLNPGMEKLIKDKTIGKISYLLDSDVDAYPDRIFIGEPIDNIPYLKFTKCSLSKFHADTISSHPSDKLDINAKSLVDIAFPNPEDDNIGIYNSSELISKIRSADEKWKSDIGIAVSENGRHLMGTFLQYDNLKKYSTKYVKLIDNLDNILKKKDSGKIMIYHHRVSSSGVLLIGEILKMNGFIPSSGVTVDTTKCANCGVIHKNHKNVKEHKFVPATFISAHSDLDRGQMMHGINKYNAETNTDGSEIKILLGSRIIREGINLMAVRHQIILNFPTDYPTLIQIFGRVVRKGSHKLLPPELQNVEIRMLISDTNHELNQYRTKGTEYLNIQAIEKILHINAVDNFLNKEKFDFLVQGKDTLEALPYEYERYKKNMITDTYFAYGHANDDMQILISVIHQLFNTRPVWTIKDLYNTLLTNPVRGANVDFSYLKYEMLELAIYHMKKRKNVHKNLYQTENFLIMSKQLDYHSYLTPCIENHTKRFSIINYIQTKGFDNKWESQINSFIKQYCANDVANPLMLLNFSQEFHYKLLENIIVEKVISKNKAIVNSIISLYYKYNILISAQQMWNSEVKKGKYKNPSQPVGYATESNVKLYDNTSNQWYYMSLESYKIRRKTTENNYNVGLCEQFSESKASPDPKYQSKYLARYKIRPPIDKIKSQIVKLKQDGRMANTGLACVSRTKAEITEMYNTFSSLAGTKKLSIKNSAQMCEHIKLLMLKLELSSKKEKYVYLFNEIPPIIKSL